ncbi:uncharacterized protein LOC127791731 [Diospyros lotus]|uniref:uncharacterized protein LOC127791731 n=1 Tax=Diospyros lotus TaxID=55363 RepID=UPI00225026C6|nr:uncharacterized protein LOC127791731 [Diospyros lotus]
MTMERSNTTGSSGGSTTSSGNNSGAVVVSIECLGGSSKADEWSADMLQTGDIVEELRIGNGYLSVTSPFKNGRAGVQKVLHSSFKAKQTSILVRVRRGHHDFAELQACIVPNDAAGKKQSYMLRSIHDPNYAVGFLDRTEGECLALQDSRASRIVNALARAELQDGYVGYPWERRMQELLPVPNSSCFLSMLLLPKASDISASRYHDLEDTLARANAWLSASQASGVPIVFMNIQTEPLLTKISGETASSTVNAGSLSDLSNLANTSLYGFEDYHGVDIGVVRAVRLWYSPLGGEVSVEIKLKETDTKLGFAISRTEEGFIYISSVIDGDDNAPSRRSGLSNMYKEAKKENKRLVVSRVSNQKVLPWIVSPTGAVRCFDTVSLSQKLSLHRHAKVPIVLHVLLWDRAFASTIAATPRLRTTPPVLPLPTEIHLTRPPNENQISPLPPEGPSGSGALSDRPENRLDRDTAGEFSFRFHDFSLPKNWV